jgi:hypothetical protein
LNKNLQICKLFGQKFVNMQVFVYICTLKMNKHAINTAKLTTDEDKEQQDGSPQDAHFEHGTGLTGGSAPRP